MLLRKQRASFDQVSELDRVRTVAYRDCGLSFREIGSRVGRNQTTLMRICDRWKQESTTDRRVRSHPPLCTTSRADRQIVRMALTDRSVTSLSVAENAGATRVTLARVDRRILRQAVAVPQATCTAILQHVQDTLDHSISTRTISRRLVANGLHSCRPLRGLPLTPPNRRQRLEWCRARSTWMTEWHRVVFSDESRFCLSSDSRRVRVWRRRGERSNPAAIVERPTVRQRGIMVWGAIAYDSRSPLLRIQGTMTAQRYVDDVLRPVTLPYLQGVPNALYQQDNARPHTARISQ
ncbi:hypothetical protein LAZ67_22000440 [Cordylochernes scorpioides]|uniref:Transposase Tc1-like domain-containing protein n=1 Tax=Cordylochernes scorpioides TaxID=51811 RepID=A0ABY6LT33_9ARAC|nr:hypothetical protein LAZ67_22000440 [Cordylochernes scorpioides]